ncbi:hypothetical protein AAMO2058_001574000 [Amorphochlora amoebiformis]
MSLKIIFAQLSALAVSVMDSKFKTDAHIHPKNTIAIGSFLSANTNPTWHLPAICGEGDINALFRFNGIWHLMQQTNPRPHRSIAHSVSPDLLSWSRIADVFEAGDNQNQQCFDGSPSFVTLDGSRTPFLMMDGGCSKYQGGTLPCMESLGNGSTGGVTAIPVDLSDKNLTKWNRRGPTTFEGCQGAAGPSPIFEGGRNNSVLSFVAIFNNVTARFEAKDDTLTNFKLVDPYFLPNRGGGGGLWHPLPANVEGVEGGRWASHIFQTDIPGTDGRPSFLLAALDRKRLVNTRITPPMLLDVGRGVAYGQLNLEGGPETHDTRMIHISWLDRADAFGRSPCTEPQTTSFREVRYDPRLGENGSLVENPVAEYYDLRGDLISKAIGALGPDLKVIAILNDSTTYLYDFEANFFIPSDVETQLRLELNCEAVGACDNGTVVLFTVTNNDLFAERSRNISMDITTPHEKVRTNFPLFASETKLLFRAMSDRNSIEIFAGGGRGVYSGINYHRQKNSFISANSSSEDVDIQCQVWKLSPIEYDDTRLLRSQANGSS